MTSICAVPRILILATQQPTISFLSVSSAQERVSEKAFAHPDFEITSCAAAIGFFQLDRIGAKQYDFCQLSLSLPTPTDTTWHRSDDPLNIAARHSPSTSRAQASLRLFTCSLQPSSWFVFISTTVAAAFCTSLTFKVGKRNVLRYTHTRLHTHRHTIHHLHKPEASQLP